MQRKFGKIVATERYTTTDGEVFDDFDDAYNHQSELDSKEIAQAIVEGFRGELEKAFDGYTWNQ